MNNIISLRLRYFPFTGRPTPIRDALNMGKVVFEDVHVLPEELAKKKKGTDYLII